MALNFLATFLELIVEESLEAPLSSDEQKQLNQYVTAVLNDQDPTIKELQPQQMRKLFTFVEAIQNALDEEQQLKRESFHLQLRYQWAKRWYHQFTHWVVSPTILGGTTSDCIDRPFLSLILTLTSPKNF
jgi:hypothetical protein